MPFFNDLGREETQHPLPDKIHQYTRLERLPQQGLSKSAYADGHPKGPDFHSRILRGLQVSGFRFEPAFCPRISRTTI
jgi:hypothetical protein